MSCTNRKPKYPPPPVMRTLPLAAFPSSILFPFQCAGTDLQNTARALNPTRLSRPYSLISFSLLPQPLASPAPPGREEIQRFGAGWLQREGFPGAGSPPGSPRTCGGARCRPCRFPGRCRVPCPALPGPAGSRGGADPGKWKWSRAGRGQPEMVAGTLGLCWCSLAA